MHVEVTNDYKFLGQCQQSKRVKFVEKDRKVIGNEVEDGGWQMLKKDILNEVC